MYVIDSLSVLEVDQQNTKAMLTYVYKESRVRYQNALRCSWFCASAPIRLFGISVTSEPITQGMSERVHSHFACKMTRYYRVPFA